MRLHSLILGWSVQSGYSLELYEILEFQWFCRQSDHMKIGLIFESFRNLSWFIYWWVWYCGMCHGHKFTCCIQEASNFVTEIQACWHLVQVPGWYSWQKYSWVYHEKCLRKHVLKRFEKWSAQLLDALQCTWITVLLRHTHGTCTFLLIKCSWLVAIFAGGNPICWVCKNDLLSPVSEFASYIWVCCNNIYIIPGAESCFSTEHS